MKSQSRTLRGAFVAMAVAALAVPAVGQAACPQTASTQAFAKFQDLANYTLVPGGGFETGMPGWTMSGGAAVVAGNESHFLRGASDQRSLRLPVKASAVSPEFCVSVDHPTMRLVTRQVTGTTGQLKVEIIYSGSKVKKAGLFANTGTYTVWNPSPELPLAIELPSNLMALGSTNVRIKVTADSGGTWEVDDVYYDPRVR